MKRILFVYSLSPNIDWFALLSCWLSRILNELSLLLCANAPFYRPTCQMKETLSPLLSWSFLGLLSNKVRRSFPDALSSKNSLSIYKLKKKKKKKKRGEGETGKERSYLSLSWPSRAGELVAVIADATFKLRAWLSSTHCNSKF